MIRRHGTQRHGFDQTVMFVGDDVILDAFYVKAYVLLTCT